MVPCPGGHIHPHPFPTPWTSLAPRKVMRPGIHTPPLWTDRHLWKHYLPATTVAGGKNFLHLVTEIAVAHVENKIQKNVRSYFDLLIQMWKIFSDTCWRVIMAVHTRYSHSTWIWSYISGLLATGFSVQMKGCGTSLAVQDQFKTFTLLSPTARILPVQDQFLVCSVPQPGSCCPLQAPPRVSLVSSSSYWPNLCFNKRKYCRFLGVWWFIYTARIRTGWGRGGGRGSTRKRAGTIGNNRSWSLSQTSVNISALYIRAHWSRFHSLS